jgi:predicted nucleic acid-binding protein
LRTTVAARRITEAEAERALAAFLSLPITLLVRAFAFAKTHRLPSIYDSLYVVLAQMTNTELWTGDKRLINAVGKVAPWIRFIGDYPQP